MRLSEQLAMGRIAGIVLILAMTVMPIFAKADARWDAALAAAKIADTTLLSKTTQVSSELGEAASEVLPGNGRRAGYVLGHGNIVPGSEWVYIGVKRAKPNVDYTIDYESGNLFFTEPVRQSESVRVDYRYLEKTKGERSVTGPGLMPLKFAGGNLQTNLTYSYRAADSSRGPGAPDILTYGLSSTMSFAGSSSLQSLFYVATPQASNRLTLSNNVSVNGKGQGNKEATKVKKDQLILQNADFGLGGKARLKLGFQNVGESFAGMQSLREAKVAPEDVLNQLEREKGIKRLSMSFETPTGKSGGLNFSRSDIEDKNGKIVTQTLGYSSDNFRFSYFSRDVDKEFARFKDLKEADAAQMAAEAGVKRTNYTMQFRTGADSSNTPLWSGFNFVRLQSESGELNYRTFDLDTGKVKIQADVRTMDPQFSAMGALTDKERTRMAQIARRQFNPKAQASDVTPQDKAQVNKEAGINRKSYSFQYDGWILGMGNLELSNGSSLNTNLFGLERSWGSVHIYHHRIDSNFDRLAMLQPIEITRFGNETGMSRTNINGNFNLGFGELTFVHGNVTDHQDADIRRHSISFKNSRLRLRTNFQNIDADFSRINDLSDTDKDLLAKERGFKRSDFSVNFDVTRHLNIDTYLYDSTNVTADQTRSQSRYNVTYNPDRGPRFALLSDDFSYISDEGNIVGYSRRKVTFDNKINLFGGLLFKGLSDVNTTQERNNDPITTKITQTHLETDQKAPTSYTLDTLITDYGDGRFEDSWDLGAKTQVGRNMSLVGGYSRIDREDNKSETNAKIGFDWSVRNDLTMSLRIANRDGGPKGSQQAREFTMKGLLAKRFIFLNDVTVDSGLNTTDLKGKRIGCDNGLKINAGVLGGKFTFDNSDKLNQKNGLYYTSRIIQYESEKKPDSRYYLTFFRQNLITPNGEPARKRNYALDLKIDKNTNLTLTSFFGKDSKNGVILPTGGSVYKISRLLGNNNSVFADYTTERNKATGRYARTVGCGFVGSLSNKAAFEFYFGWSNLVENGLLDHDNVFRIKYDHKIDGNRFITLTAQKKSGVDKSAINPFEGNTTARLDFRTVFD